MVTPYSKTTDGFEAQFSTNHSGPFLFTNLILPRLLASTHDPRVVNVASVGHQSSQMQYEEQDFRTEEFGPNLLDADGKPVLEMWNLSHSKPFLKGHIVAAFDPSIMEQSGCYLDDENISNETMRPYALDDYNTQKLWELSENLIKVVAYCSNTMTYLAEYLISQLN
ncbi:hypothetical protein K7432_015596 [Basidiobolus ranarum]|uniref:Uncharacterized protein n=1 Tax=Basidiobolus ranarum TaxID=34480 RepID=A0ABR2VMW0_9FUNG